jgi:hypothetical protein
VFLGVYENEYFVELLFRQDQTLRLLLAGSSVLRIVISNMAFEQFKYDLGCLRESLLNG